MKVRKEAYLALTNFRSSTSPTKNSLSISDLTRSLNVSITDRYVNVTEYLKERTHSGETIEKLRDVYYGSSQIYQIPSYRNLCEQTTSLSVVCYICFCVQCLFYTAQFSVLFFRSVLLSSRSEYRAWLVFSIKHFCNDSVRIDLTNWNKPFFWFIRVVFSPPWNWKNRLFPND